VRNAMSTIPTTIRETIPAYTAVGGNERRGSTGLSLVLLNRGVRQSRHILFQELEKEGFDYIVSIEGTQARYDLEDLAGNFPFVRFILLKEDITPGEAINLAAVELGSPLFLVLWSDFKVIRGGAERIAGKFLFNADMSSGREEGIPGRICTVPVIQNNRVETLASLSAPVLDRRTFKTIPFTPDREGLPSLYPFEGIGIYDRERFIQSGGFDGGMNNFHWQLLDFGFRSWLWGDEIVVTQSVKLSCEGFGPIEDSTLDDSYRRFRLKNLAPVFRGDHAHIPLKVFPGCCWERGGDIFSAWEEFSAARRWVRTNRYRWRQDLAAIISQWQDIPENGLPAGAAGAEVPAAPEGGA